MSYPTKKIRFPEKFLEKGLICKECGKEGLVEGDIFYVNIDDPEWYKFDTYCVGCAISLGIFKKQEMCHTEFGDNTITHEIRTPNYPEVTFKVEWKCCYNCGCTDIKNEDKLVQCSYDVIGHRYCRECATELDIVEGCKCFGRNS